MSSPSVKVRSPMAVVALSVVTLGIYLCVWYFKINRELRDFGRAREDADLAETRPWWSLVAITVGSLLVVPAVVSVVRTVGRMRAAEALMGPERRGAGVITAALVAGVVLGAASLRGHGLVLTLASSAAWLVGSALLQSRLNGVWHRDPVLLEHRPPVAV
jgi:hypothetical protein